MEACTLLKYHIMRNFISILGIALCLFYSCGTGPANKSESTVLRGATIFDGNGNRLENGTILVHDGKIEAIGDASLKVPNDANTIDLSGKFITPGLVDAHVHFAQTGFVDGRPDAFDIRDSINYIALQAMLETEPEHYFEAYLRSGVTAVYDVGGFPWSIAMQQSAENNLLAPHVAAAGPLLTPVPQKDLETFNTPSQKQMLELKSPEFGREAVIQNTDMGSTGIKIWQINLQDEKFMKALEAVAEETRAKGNKLIVHSTSLDQAKKALELEAKVLVHSVDDAEVDVAFLARAKQLGITYIPTLVVLHGYYYAYKAILDGGFVINDPNKVIDARTRSLLEGAHRFASLGDTASLRESLPRFERFIGIVDSIMGVNLRKVYKSGIRIAVGTDAGNPGTLHGVSIFDELEAFQAAGIPPDEILVMATRNGAIAMDRSADIGTLEPGKLADLVVMDKDPSADISNLRTLTHVMRGGVLRPVNLAFDPKRE
jgi:imidazolonepropionase-like amidohydrolase